VAQQVFRLELQGWGAGEHEWTLLGTEDAALEVPRKNKQQS
jgi:hypothetical protein